uniref:Uncharacterized protein n=1 Tax=Sinocyclocheilus grahami TaxID=75366 RepID=A0A672MXH6_SINGR
MELGARLEEKRKAIEAQKKRIEAIFAKHRQRLGKTAFLQLKKEQEGGDEISWPLTVGGCKFKKKKFICRLMHFNLC